MQLSREKALGLLAPLLEDPSILKIGQNIKYDALVLSRHGVNVAPIDDTMLLSFVLDGGRHGHGMDVLAETHLNMTTVKYKDVVGTGKKQVTFDYVPLESARDYAAAVRLAARGGDYSTLSCRVSCNLLNSLALHCILASSSF